MVWRWTSDLVPKLGLNNAYCVTVGSKFDTIWKGGFAISFPTCQHHRKRLCGDHFFAVAGAKPRSCSLQEKREGTHSAWDDLRQLARKEFKERPGLGASFAIFEPC